MCIRKFCYPKTPPDAGKHQDFENVLP